MKHVVYICVEINKNYTLRKQKHKQNTNIWN